MNDRFSIVLRASCCALVLRPSASQLSPKAGKFLAPAPPQVIFPGRGPPMCRLRHERNGRGRNLPQLRGEGTNHEVRSKTIRPTQLFAREVSDSAHNHAGTLQSQSLARGARPAGCDKPTQYWERANRQNGRRDTAGRAKPSEC